MKRKFFDVREQIDNISDWMKNYLIKSGAGGYVIGLSGGVDSSVVAALAVKSIGVNNVYGLIMPIESNVDDERDAIDVAEELGISYDIVDMSISYNGMIEAFPGDFIDDKLLKANVKARLRMTMLYQFAGEYRYLVAGTGNKSEDSIGYFTKYGDGGVDILPIVEFYKWEVREMALALGLRPNIANRISTAGLWEGQTDEKDIGMTYDVLDSILYWLETGNEYPILHVDKIDKVKKMINANKHKNEYPSSYKRRSI